MTDRRVKATAPGRVNLIGDHTDYTGGLVLPMAIDRSTAVEIERDVSWIELVSDADSEPLLLVPGEPLHPSAVEPAWGRYVAGVVSLLQPEPGGRGFVATSLPLGAGLGSSAALEVATALALGFDGPPLALAQLCQQAEHLATATACGIMDQLAAVSGVEGHALLIDCTTYDSEAIPVPDDLDVVVVDSGQRRQLAASRYGVRRAQCEEAEVLIGPLRDASISDAESIEMPDLRRRARHVVTENRRVREMARALRQGDTTLAGAVMRDGHASLSEDFEVSTRVIDDLVRHLWETPGVLGARMTGGGFGGCIVALCQPGSDLGSIPHFVVRAAGAARIQSA